VRRRLDFKALSSVSCLNDLGGKRENRIERQMMRKLVVGAAMAAFLGTAGSAAAGGLYEGEGSMKDTRPVAPVAIWSGLYIGGTVGFGTGDTSDRLDIDTDEFDLDLGFFTLDESINEPLEALLGNDYDMDGAVYGGFIGYNWQMNNAVFGIEAGLNGTDFDGHTDCGLIGLSDCKRELDYYATVTGRVGYAVNNLMFYGFGGVAWGDVKSRVTVGGVQLDDIISSLNSTPGGPSPGVDVSSSLNNEETHVGWTAGAGLEFAFTERFVAGVEYAHVDLGEERHRIVSGSVDDVAINIDNEVDVSFDVVKVRASYKLWHGSRESLETFK
jgi:outer membrane immunogenic protein